MRPNRSSLRARARLKELIETTPGVTPVALSRLIRKPDRYLSTFIRTRTPTRLDGADRACLARFFGIEECELSIPRSGEMTRRAVGTASTGLAW